MKRFAALILALFAALSTAAQAEQLNAFSIAPGDAASAKVVLAPQAQPTLEIVLTADKAKELADFTQANLGNQIALEIAGEVVSTPLVTAPIAGGELAITLGDAETAQRHANKLLAD